MAYSPPRLSPRLFLRHKIPKEFTCRYNSQDFRLEVPDREFL
jgi:hypothetical protein